MDNFEHDIEVNHNSIRGIEVEKEKALSKFSLRRDHLSPQVAMIQNQLEECIVEKASYDKFAFIELNLVELT